MLKWLRNLFTGRGRPPATKRKRKRRTLVEKPLPRGLVLATALETTIAGVGHAESGDHVLRLNPGESVFLKRDPSNADDKNAVEVCNSRGKRLGYIPGHVAKELAREMDNPQKRVRASVHKVVEGGPEYPDPKALILVQIYMPKRKRRNQPLGLRNSRKTDVLESIAGEERATEQDGGRDRE